MGRADHVGEQMAVVVVTVVIGGNPGGGRLRGCQDGALYGRYDARRTVPDRPAGAHRLP